MRSLFSVNGVCIYYCYDCIVMYYDGKNKNSMCQGLAERCLLLLEEYMSINIYGLFLQTCWWCHSTEVDTMKESCS